MTTVRFALAVLLISAISPARGAVAVGDKPALRLHMLDGVSFDLRDFRGKMVLIDFFYGKSDLDKNYHKPMFDLYAKQKDKGLIIVGICCAPRLDDVRAIIDEQKFPWPIAHNPEGFRGGLAAEWGVQRLPQDFLISPDGAVLWTGSSRIITDIVEAQMIQHPPQLVDPDVLRRANEELASVEALLGDKDREGAVRKFTRIADEASKDPDFAKHAMTVREKINEAADSLLREADELIEAKQYAQAATRLKQLLSTMAGLPTASLARTRLAELMSRPEVQHEMQLADRRDKGEGALAEARKLRDAGEEAAAYTKFKAVAADFTDTPAGKAAEDAVKAFESQPSFQRRVKDHAAAPRAKAALNLAENYRSAGQIDKARKKYQEVIKDFPDTSFADTAKSELEQLK